MNGFLGTQHNLRTAIWQYRYVLVVPFESLTVREYQAPVQRRISFTPLQQVVQRIWSLRRTTQVLRQPKHAQPQHPIAALNSFHLLLHFPGSLRQFKRYFITTDGSYYEQRIYQRPLFESTASYDLTGHWDHIAGWSYSIYLTCIR